MYVLIGILLLGILIAVHEFGHFMAARLTGIEVMEFAIGMGPKLFGWTGKSGTKFSLRCIPLGGFCAFYGEDDVEGKAKDDPRAYNRQSVWKRMFTVIMGPAMNFVLAFVVAVGYYWIGGVAMVEPVIMEVEQTSPAYAAGLQSGDVIISVNGVNVLDGTMDTLSAVIGSGSGEPYALLVRRGSETFDASITPFWDEALSKYRIGITYGGAPTGGMRRLPFPEAVAGGWNVCVSASTLIIDTLGQMFTNSEILDQTSGPVGAVAVISQEVKTGGFDAFLNLLVVISINLGIMNLLPIPGLDGSRFLFMVIEVVRRKPIKPEREAMVHLIGMLFLFALMIWFTFRDVWKLIG